jgi:hypothetical protein
MMREAPLFTSTRSNPRTEQVSYKLTRNTSSDALITSPHKASSFSAHIELVEPEESACWGTFDVNYIHIALPSQKYCLQLISNPY